MKSILYYFIKHIMSADPPVDIDIAFNDQLDHFVK